MRALAFDFEPFMNLLRCTATSESLHELADALQLGGASALHKVITAYGRSSAVKSGRRTRVDVDYTKKRAISLTFAKNDCNTIADGLRRLAGEPDCSTLSLADLGLLTRDTSDNDLEFFKLDKAPELKRDYDPHVPGSTWEGVLYHIDPTAQQFRQVRDVILEWAVPTSDGHEQELFAVSPHNAHEKVDLALAHSRLLDPNDPTYQINIFIEHPLAVRYALPHTGAQVWLTKDSSEIIISEHCIASGDFQADLSNFFAYRQVLLSMSEILNPTSIAWGDCADTWPMEEASNPASLKAEDEMWTSFATGLQPSLGRTQIPPQVRAMFGQRFKKEKT